MPAAWIGGLSSDRFGRMLEAGLVGDGVQVALAQRTDLPTTLALAEIGADGAASYHFYTDSTSAPAVLPGPMADGLPASARAFLTGSLGLVLEPMASTLEAVACAVPADRIVMLDPNARPSITRDPDAWRARMTRVMARADIVKASTEDLEYLRPGSSHDEAAAWVRDQGPTVVLVTDGARPIRVLAGDAAASVVAPPVEVVDTVGAGDTFGGAFLACLVHWGVGPDGLADALGGARCRAVRRARIGGSVRPGRGQPADPRRARGLAGDLPAAQTARPIGRPWRSGPPACVIRTA